MEKLEEITDHVSSIVLMGVTGSGKTTIGEMLAEKLSWTFLDADHYHPSENVEKMRQGIPLNEDDRKPWLHTLSELISTSVKESKPVILACSALKKSYRDILRQGSIEIMFVYLQGDEELIGERLAERKGHYMNPALLPSQFEALEAPSIDEAIHVDISPDPEVIVADILNNMRAGTSVEFS